jgi:hypothetical protein
MIWKFLRLQKLFDSIFDDRWILMGLPEQTAFDEISVCEILEH